MHDLAVHAASTRTPALLRAVRASDAHSINVHHQERLASAVAGGLAVAWGLSQRSLGGALATALGGGFLYRALSGHCHLYDALGVSTKDDARALPVFHQVLPRHYEVLRSVSIQQDPTRIYAAWKDPQVLAQVMHHLAEVEPLEGGRTRWRLRDPLGRAHDIETEVIEDVPGTRLRWQSVGGAMMMKTGALALRAAPGGRGTEVTLHLRFDRPAGWLGDLLERVLGPVPAGVAQHALNNLKSILEAGELPSLHNNPSARS